MKIIGNEKILIVILSLLLIVGFVAIISIVVEYKLFFFQTTGQVTGALNEDAKNKEVYTGKNCFFNVGNKTISIYSCNDKIDCKNKIDSLKFDLENASIDTSTVSVINCASFLNS